MTAVSYDISKLLSQELDTRKLFSADNITLTIDASGQFIIVSEWIKTSQRSSIYDIMTSSCVIN